MDHNRVAEEISSWLADAVGDAAYGMGASPESFCEPHLVEKIKRAKKDGVRDISEWLADELYNDEDTISDLIGDRIHDEARGSYPDMIEIARVLADGAHDALKQACESHIESWAKRS